jgi:flagellar hook protein FlgE
MKFYTRDGAFYRDYSGNLVNAGGYNVMGYVPPTGQMLLSDAATSAPLSDGPLSSMSIKQSITVDKIDADGNPYTETLSLETFSIDGSGQIIGVFSDGNPYLLGQLAVAKFDNEEGLEKAGNNNYRASNNSGQE